MQIELRIPLGYRKLNGDERLQEGDLTEDDYRVEWVKTRYAGTLVKDIVSQGFPNPTIYIRKVDL